jgi:hypothetical protein
MFNSFVAESLFRKKEVNGALSFLCLKIAKKVTLENTELTTPPIKSTANITV